MIFLFFASVIVDGSAAIGMPPELPMSVWISGRIVMSMKSYARSLALLFVGTTHRLPDEPGASVLPGNRKVSQSNFASAAIRPYHHVPLTSIGYLPAIHAVPMSSA